MKISILKKVNQIFFLLFIFSLSLFSQTHIEPQTIEIKGYPVIVDGDTLIKFYEPLGSFNPEVRANETQARLLALFNKKEVIADSFNIKYQNNFYLIRYKSQVLFSITDYDAKYLNRKSDELAEEYLAIIKDAAFEYSVKYSNSFILKRLGISLGILLLLLLLLFLLRKLFPKVYIFIESLEGKLFKSISIKKIEILTAENLIITFLALAKLLRLFTTLLIIYISIEQIFAALPWTENWRLPALRGFFLTVFLTFFAFTLLKGINSLTVHMLKRIRVWKGSLIRGISIKKVNIVSEERIINSLFVLLKTIRNVINILIVYFYITVVFSLYEFTQNWASTLISYLVDPFISVIKSMVEFLPSLVFIVVIIIVTRYIIKFIRFIFSEIEKGNLEIPRFLPDWSMPTFKIFRFLIIVFAVIIIYPHLPGSSSKAFEGVSVMLGILLSLASASAISNIVSGTVLTYMNAFKLGDRVKIADTVGDIIEKTLLVTRVRTAKNVEITIPNSIILSNHLINFSKSQTENKLILHTTVTIGYDVPWKQVHQLLIDAALNTEGIFKEISPFVLQTSLDDFYVSYELNAYTDSPNRMAFIYSELHENTQDKFNEAGVEIMSPHYGAHRDGNQSAIPSDYLPKDYKVPSFQISQIWESKKEEKKDE
ncbi:MAG: mechanosensitive ion channel family protein [Ignavibacteria bacterium]|nr:mechanosensitive ion channel family protein [Ignavibacteria bacterium]